MELPVISRLATNISEIDTLPKHVASDGCLWRRNSKTLGNDTRKVCCPRTVPKEPSVRFHRAAAEGILLPFAVDLEYVLDGERVCCVCGTVAVLDAVVDEGPLAAAGREWLNI